ncbi:hypothetical protein [Streptomyces mobaraensis]|uniref:Uncharacterized protein n=1 Tax=Streptomyces mobaraensis TaxID=35621 RepID=A0A5N5WEM6_STRMB|nr:hypothetical protein [Streptomyces mobaraensis]KAB7850195.1 hypothetical protein FRZ00_06245 [Streptomyces mobaraensis]
MPDTAINLPPRTAALLARIREQGGEWSTNNVRRAFEEMGFNAPQRVTARHDLEYLTRAGFLIRHEHTRPPRRFYTLNHAKGDA